MIITDSIIVPDLDDARRTKRSLSLNADFEMQKECFESTCPSVPFACSNGCQRSDLQSPLKAITIRFYQDNYAKRVGSSTQGHLSRSTSFDSDEQSNMTETANASVEKFLTRKETERGREYKMTWPDNWMSEAEMMNTLDMILTFMSEKVRDN